MINRDIYENINDDKIKKEIQKATEDMLSHSGRNFSFGLIQGLTNSSYFLSKVLSIQSEIVLFPNNSLSQDEVRVKKEALDILLPLAKEVEQNVKKIQKNGRYLKDVFSTLPSRIKNGDNFREYANRILKDCKSSNKEELGEKYHISPELAGQIKDHGIAVEHLNDILKTHDGLSVDDIYNYQEKFVNKSYQGIKKNIDEDNIHLTTPSVIQTMQDRMSEVEQELEEDAILSENFKNIF